MGLCAAIGGGLSSTWLGRTAGRSSGNGRSYGINDVVDFLTHYPGSWPMAPTSAIDYTLPGDDARLRER